MKSTSLFLAGLGVASIGIQSAWAVARYYQCGGIGYTGDTVCDPGSICTYFNPYLSQCLPEVLTTTKANHTTTTTNKTPTTTETTTTTKS